MIFDRKVILAVTFSAGVFFRAAAAAEGKSSKGTKSQNNPVPLYFLNPSSCPQDCVQCYDYSLLYGTPAPEIDGHGTGEAVQPCDAENIHQMWRLHQKDGLTMIESVFNSGDCLAVVSPQDGGTQLDHAVLAASNSFAGFFPPAEVLGTGASIMHGTDVDHAVTAIGMVNMVFTGAGAGDGWVVDDICKNGSVGLASCNDPAAQWFLNGANLISALCWKNGISSFLTVNEECSELSVLAADGGNDALLRSQTFMLTEEDFIETIVPVSTDEADANDLGNAPFGYDGIQLGGALTYPDDESGPVEPAHCNPTCENGKICAKYSPTEAGGECYTKCPNRAFLSGACETPDETCVIHYSDETGVTLWCQCKFSIDRAIYGLEGDYEWVCMAK
jgi:hypothetical protein